MIKLIIKSRAIEYNNIDFGFWAHVLVSVSERQLAAMPKTARLSP